MLRIAIKNKLFKEQIWCNFFDTLPCAVGVVQGGVSLCSEAKEKIETVRAKSIADRLKLSKDRLGFKKFGFFLGIYEMPDYLLREQMCRVIPFEIKESRAW